jgi:DNA polymerase I-like protein with 3'-5' exonuclease and polymerase domains
MAASITNRGMLDTTRLMRKQNLDGYVYLQIHDEIQVYAREDHAEQISKCLQKGMEDNKFTELIDIDMIAEPVICDSIKEAK